jgi:predicted nucleic-acid-binding Zn-ribbon protein
MYVLKQKSRCPRCLGTEFVYSDVQTFDMEKIWECVSCGKDFFESRIEDRTPDGCVTIACETEI